MLKLLPERTNGSLVWESRCECGNLVNKTSDYLRQVKFPACPRCARIHHAKHIANVRTKHGFAMKEATRQAAPEYRIWHNMKQRCLNPRFHGYKNYGGNPQYPVTVCDRWRHSFEAFIADVGLRPSTHHSLDRVNPFGSYSPDNVRWALPDVQRQNTRKAWLKKYGTPFPTRRMNVPCGEYLAAQRVAVAA